MEFGISVPGPDLENRRDPFGRCFAWCERAEALGFDYVMVPHHRFTPGYDVHPWTALAAIAARTSSIRLGTSIFLFGLMKKLVIADPIASVVDPVFADVGAYSGASLWVAALGYAIQIYADFSGYTDVARGSAMLFGYDLPENFAAPYTSDTIQDFWRRWHMSLSSWLRDYLYIPLGGNRGGTLATYRNLLLTMVLGGLWHGASWNFVLWGALHGGGLGVERATAEKKLARVLAFPAVALIALYGLDLLHEMSPRTYVFVLATTLGTIAVGVALAYLRKAEGAGRWFAKPVAVVLCFHFVCFCWIFFRAPTFDHGLLMLLRLGKGTLTSTNLSPLVLRVLLLGAVLHFVPKKIEDDARALFTRAPAPLQGVILAACGYLLHFAASTKAEPFVYGQF
jgi:D-alanyl-lipoteichoic acid acyltransferase DltB (MBOAT superfamily)